MSKTFPSVQTCFGAFFWKETFCPVFPGGPGFRKFSKKWKKFKIPKVPKIFSKSVHTCFEHALWRFFWIFFAECSMQGFSVILDLKMWVQFYDTLLNRHSFFIHATVNKRNSTSDILDLKLWVQNPEFKNMSSVFRTWKMWVQFSGPKFWGRELEKIKGKNQKSFKVAKMSKNVSKCPNVFWGDFFENAFFAQCSMESSKVFEKIKKISKLQKCPKSLPKMSKLVLNMFCGNFLEKNFFPVFHVGSGFRKFSKLSKNFQNFLKVPKVVSKSVQTCFEHRLRRFFRIFSPCVPCTAFQIFWT